MKNLIAFIFMAVALSLAAVDFNESFNACLAGGNLQAADSILRIWSSKAPNDNELFPARFNLLLNRAHSEMLVLSAEMSQRGEGLVLTDSTGSVAGYLRGETMWQDSLVDEAFAEIDRGIAACPDRIDFRLGKAAAASMTGRWNVTIEALDGLLDREKENGGHWTGNGDMEETNADTLLMDAVYDRISEIFGAESQAVTVSALPFVDKAAQRFGGDTRIINIAGAMNFCVGNNEAAMRYFVEALRITPEDAIPLTNIAYLHYQQGDTAKALEIYREIEAGDYDDDTRKYANGMIADITRPVKDMEEYYYFFGYLPRLAEDVEAPAYFADVELVNSQIPAYNKMRSPFPDADIRAENLPVEGKDMDVVVWTFSMPDMIPMCRFVAFVSDGNGGCHVYTLEKSLEDCWVVGTMNNNIHGNFGDIPLPVDAAAFVKALEKKDLLK